MTESRPRAHRLPTLALWRYPVTAMTTNPTGNAARAKPHCPPRDGDGPAEQRLNLHIALPACMALRRPAKHHGSARKLSWNRSCWLPKRRRGKLPPTTGAAYYTLLGSTPTEPLMNCPERCYPVTPQHRDPATPPAGILHQPAGGGNSVSTSGNFCRASSCVVTTPPADVQAGSSALLGVTIVPRHCTDGGPRGPYTPGTRAASRAPCGLYVNPAIRLG